MTVDRNFETPLPIDAALPELTAALRAKNAAVLVAPPGAGKTTRVPLVLLEEAWAKGRILLLEPRRLAARAAAARMAATLGEQVGDTVGLRVRFGSKVSRKTRIEVVTEGVFTRLILDDPGSNGVSAVLFDEFHERSLDADLGLALAGEAQEGLREDIKLLVMSATIDGARVAKLLHDAPVVESHGRAFAVETRHLPRDAREPIEKPVVAAVMRALQSDKGSLLVFLPGAAEIRRTETLLRERVSDPAVEIYTLFGALEQQEQDRAIAPTPPGRRKIVLATSIAETSLTIEGVRVVVDSGLARVPRYEPDVGLTRLETVRVSRAAADQRRGRAGRTEPGICYRLWDEPQTASLEPYAQPEILAADLSGFVLDLAHWGVTDPQKLGFLDPPPQPAINEARALLRELDAIDAEGRITAEGKLLRGLPLPPRLARMIVDAAARRRAELAAEIAVVLTERGLGGNDVDLRHRIEGLRRDRSQRGKDARRMARGVGGCFSPGDGREERAGRGRSCYPTPPQAREAKSSPAAILALGLSRPHREKPRRRDAFLSAGEWPRRECRPRQSRCRASRFWRSRIAGRLRRAGSFWPRRSRPPRSKRFCRAYRKPRGNHFDKASASLRARGQPPAGRDGVHRTAGAGSSERAKRRQFWPKDYASRPDRLPWTKALAMARPRDVSAPGRRRGMARSFRWRARRNDLIGLCRSRWKTAFRSFRRRRSRRRAAGAAALPLRRRLDARSADAFHRAVRLGGADRLRARKGRAFDPRAGTVRARPPSLDRRAAGAAGRRAALAGAPAGAGDPRSAGFLARQLCRGESRDARPLSAPSLAGRSGAGPAHAPRQAARDLGDLRQGLQAPLQPGVPNAIIPINSSLTIRSEKQHFSRRSR